MNRDELREELRSIAYEVVEQLLAKRDDYGTENIRITGRYGIAVRIQDKASRLLNLESPGVEARFESKDDTYRDLIGYALIGLAGHHGWGLPFIGNSDTELLARMEGLVEARHETGVSE